VAFPSKQLQQIISLAGEPFPAELEAFLNRKPEARKLPGLIIYSRLRIWHRLEEWLKQNTGMQKRLLPIGRNDPGNELWVDLDSEQVFLQDDTGLWQLVAANFVAWQQQLRQEGKEYGRRPFVRAARAGDIARMERLLRRGFSINEQDIEGNTPLMAALLAWHYEAAAWLVNHGADVHRSDRQGHTALMWACYRHQPQLVQRMIEAGVDVQAHTNGGDTVLLFALTGPKDDLEKTKQIVEILVEAGVDLHRPINKNGQTCAELEDLPGDLRQWLN
jgi:ankyrin repeat protein